MYRMCRWKNSINNLVRTRSPFVHFVPWHVQYGRWNFFCDMGGVHQIRKSPHYFLSFFLSFFIYLFILFVSQLQSLLLSNKNHILKKPQQSLHSRTSNLCFTRPHHAQPHSKPLAYLTASISMKIPFLSLFCSCVDGLLVLGSCPNTCC